MKTKLIVLGLVAMILGGLGLWSDNISMADWKTYTNTRYSYQFKYPADHTAYSGLEEGKYEGEQRLIPASGDSNEVSIAVNEPFLFCCETGTLKISGSINENMSVDQWLVKETARRKKLGIEILSIRNIKISGREAVELIGGGNLGQIYKTIGIVEVSRIIEIEQSTQNAVLDLAFSTFKFIE